MSDKNTNCSYCLLPLHSQDNSYSRHHYRTCLSKLDAEIATLQYRRNIMVADFAHRLEDLDPRPKIEDRGEK